MANFESTTRTNYFSVTDEEAFDVITGKLTSDDGNGVSVWSKTVNSVKKYAFGAYGEIRYDDIPLTDSEEFLSEMQAILPDGEAFVLEEVGHEKLRYLSNMAYVITKYDSACIDLDAFIRRKVREIVQDDTYQCVLDY